MPRVRPDAVGALHRRVVTRGLHGLARGEEGRRRAYMVRHGSFHADLGFRAVATPDAYLDFLDHPDFLAALRRVPEASEREAESWLRLAWQAKAFDRADLFAIAGLGLDRSRADLGERLAQWSTIWRTRDLAGALGLARALLRIDQHAHRGGIEPGLRRVWLAAAAVHWGEALGEPDRRVIEALLAQPPHDPASLDLALSLALMRRLGWPDPAWNTPELDAARRAKRAPVAFDGDPAAGAVVARAWAEEGVTGVLLASTHACMRQDGTPVAAWLAGDAASLAWEAAEAEALWVGLVALPWDDRSRRDVVRAVPTSIWAALTPDRRWPLAARGLEAFSDDYYGCISSAAYALEASVSPCVPPEVRFSGWLAIASEHADRDVRHRLGELAMAVLADLVESEGPESVDEAVLRALFERERTLLPGLGTDAVALALARIASANQDIAGHRRWFGRIQDGWARVQAVVRLGREADADEGLVELALSFGEDAPMARMAALERTAQSFADGEPVAERLASWLAAVDAAGALGAALGWFGDGLIASVVQAPDAAVALRRLGAVMTAQTGDFDVTTAEVLVASLAVAGWSAEDALGPGAERLWAAGATQPPVGPWPLPRDGAASALDRVLEGGAWDAELPAAVLVPAFSAWRIPDPRRHQGLPPSVAGVLLRTLVEAPMSAASLRHVLDLAGIAPASLVSEADAWPLWSWVVRLGARPEGFDPPRHLALAGMFADALLRWMQEDDARSRVLVSHAADPAVQRFLDGFEAEVRDSGIARPMRGLAFAGRAALLWMGCSFFFGNRPQKILTGELLVRCGRADELARVAARFEPLWEAT